MTKNLINTQIVNQEGVVFSHTLIINRNTKIGRD